MTETDTGEQLEPIEIARRTRAAAMAARNGGAQGKVRKSTSPAARKEKAEEEATRVQALSEGVVHGDLVEFMGKWFRISNKVGMMPLMKFAAAADSDLDTSDMSALSAIYAMLKDCIYGGTEDSDDPEVAKLQAGDEGYDAGDWHKFEQHAIKMKADAEDLLPVTQQVIQLLTARPTQ